ncbi:MAG: hypothetical protein AVDCRST_MAG32-2230, partial [uncultured Nocardioides sp.]
GDEQEHPRHHRRHRGADRGDRRRRGAARARLGAGLRPPSSRRVEPAGRALDRPRSPPGRTGQPTAQPQPARAPPVADQVGGRAVRATAGGGVPDPGEPLHLVVHPRADRARHEDRAPAGGARGHPADLLPADRGTPRWRGVLPGRAARGHALHAGSHQGDRRAHGL